LRLRYRVGFESKNLFESEKEWSDVASWNPEIRYKLAGSTSSQEAHTMIAAAKLLLREL